MPEVHKIEEPTTIVNHMVWVRPADGEDWGTLRDPVYSDRTFKPNLVCVIVSESHAQFHPSWSQAREEHDYGTPEVPYVITGGAQSSDKYASRYDLPEWWVAAEDFAVDTIKGQSA